MMKGLILAGFGLISIGAGCIYWPASIILLGVFAVVTGLTSSEEHDGSVRPPDQFTR